ncbi:MULTISPECIES: FAD-dependent oxidoreductase [unclassified Moraxella]|uniref:FAD-dependent oxidoreductase n=1 Tax=unclassified Moraxella TaxID=2685852 RepID=UPI003AF9E62A
MTTKNNPLSKPLKVAIIGGGVAGSTIAIRLAMTGATVHLFEKNASLINAPPMCHLHAGGNLYREISDDDCKTLMCQCIDIARLYPHSIDVRPTIIAVPTRDTQTASDLLPRLKLLQTFYQTLIEQNPSHQVLGKAEDYYRVYQRDELESLAKCDLVANPQTTDDWLIGYAKLVDLDKLQYPVIAVQEYGWNIFRLSASAHLQLDNLPNAHVLTHTKVTDLTQSENGWQITVETNQTEQAEVKTFNVDYVINACGFRTGIIDDKVGVKVERMVEFKASYLAYWQNFGYPLPEMIFHGERGTPHGMAQFTPYPNGIFQLHGMTEAITLFKDGLSKSTDTSSQPPINPQYLDYIENGWDKSTLQNRTQKAIDYVAEFIPNFATATPIDNALYGGQQVPSDDISVRVADLQVFADKRYAIAENVKANSALDVADGVVEALIEGKLLPIEARKRLSWQVIEVEEVNTLAHQLANQRGYPLAMAKVSQALTQF